MNKIILMLFFGLLLVGSVSAANWYVDNAVATSGNGQSWSTAWKAFSNIVWSSVQPGDTIYISGGTIGQSQTYTETLKPGKSGIAGSHITITKGIDSAHSGTVIIDVQNTQKNCIYMRPKSYLLISGFKLRGFTSSAVDIEGAWSTASGTWPYINSAGQWPYTESGASRNVVIENMDIYLARGRGVFIQTSADITIRNNIITTIGYVDSQTDGIYSQYDYRSIFENNYIVINNAETSNHNDGIQTSYDVDATFIKNFIWQNNSKTSNAQGIYAENSIGVFKYYNNVYNAGDTQSNGICFKSAIKAGHAEMIGNTAYGEKSYSLFLITDDSDPVFKNNVAYAKNSILGAGVRIYNWAGNPSNIDYNVLYGPSSNFVYTIDSSSKSWSYSRGLGWDAHGYNVNPLFVDIPNMNYRLQSNSPAIDHGLTTSAYTKDKDGVSRPQGAGYDIGAFEYAAGGIICTNGQTRECNTPLLGICSDGTQTCTNNAWGFCVQNTPSLTEICGNGIDENCNGVDLACVCGNGVCDAAESCTICSADCRICLQDPAIPSVNLFSDLGPLSAGGDADDPAVWIHPTNRSKSLLFVSDKRTGVYVYNFNGQLLQNVPIGSGINKLNNIDVRKGLTCGDHQIDILAGNMRDAGKLAVLRINPNYGGGTNPLTVLASEASSGNAITLDSYLFTLYKRISDGTMYAFDKNSASGSITQWRISCSQLEQISVSSVRTISDVSMSISEGAVADDVLGYVYFVQENSGIHKYNADPSSSNLNRLSFFGSDGGTATDREGLALYACNDNSGYLLLSSQGNSQFKVYDRRTNALAKSFTTKEASGTDGIEVSPFAVTGFPEGFLAIHDGGAYYNLYDWNDISQGQLITCIDGIVSQTCNPADTNCDSCIDLGEISEYVGLWLNDKVKLADVSGAVGTWMGGC